MSTRRDYFFPRLSPDGQRLAVRLDRDIWVYGIANQTLNRLTFEAGLHNYPRPAYQGAHWRSAALRPRSRRCKTSEALSLFDVG